MPSPKDIKKLMNVAKGAKSASKAADLDEVMGRLPKIDPALQAKVDAELNEIRRRQKAAYDVPQLPKETGRKALAEAKRILAPKEAPAVIVPSKLANVEKAIRESKGEFGAKRVQRAADEVKGLEDLYTEQALRDAFGGDNATALMIGDPAKFQEFASRLEAPYRPAVERYWYSMEPDAGRGAEDVPYLMLNKEEGRLPFVAGHEGRHRNIAATELGYPSTLWRMLPRAALREPFPRRSQEEYLEALMNELGSDTPLVIPEGRFLPRLEETDELKRDWTKALQLPKLFAEGGLAMAKGGKLLKALSGKAGKSLEAAQNLLQADRPLSLAERQFVADVMAKRSEELASLRPQEMGAVEAKKSKGPSPKPERAKPKTKAEISAIAERIAPQMLGEFVRGEKGSASVVGKSRKQWELEQELQHEMQRSREVPDVETVDLEPHLGSVMLSLPGDTSISDYDIFSIGGNRLREPARQYGGPRFGLGHPEEAGWASGLDQAAGFQRRVNAASQQYGDVPVLANYLAMGPEGLNYATHFTDTLLKSIDPTKMSAKDIDAVNRALRAGKQGVAMPDFPGIENPEAAYLYLANNPVGRKLVFNPSMQLITETEALGLPSGLNVRHAITEPELRDIEPGMTGFSLLQMQPGVTGLKPSKHPTYSHDIPGKFLGRTDVLMPYELTFPDTVAAIRANPRQAKSEFGTLQMLGGKQIIDQQLLDEIGEYRRRLKQLTGKAEGGVVHMQGGGNPGEVSGEMFKPKPLKIPSLFQDTINALKAEYERNRQSMVRPGSVQDVLMRGPVAQYVGTPMDFVGDVGAALEHVQKTHPLLRKPASVMDTGPLRKPEMGYAPRVSLTPEGPHGSEAVREMMKSSGMTTGTERPLFEMGASLLAPTIGAGSYKLGKALAPTAREVLEAGLERAVEPTRMYAVPPGKPGKVKAPANPMGFYNPAEKAALNLQRKQGPGSAFISDMKKLEQGVNDERIAELGLDQLASKPNVTRDEVVALAEQNRIPLKETVRRPQREVDDIDDFENTEISLEDSINYYQGGIRQVQAELDRVLATAPDSPLVGQYQEKIRAMQRAIEDKQDKLLNAKPAKFGPDMDESYSLPGGEDYREIRVRLPERKGELPSMKGFTVETVYENKFTGQRDIYIRDPQGNIVTNRYGFRGDDAQALQDEAASRARDANKENNFYHRTHHDDEPNVLFHLRVANHVDEEGKRGLLIDELQSDWHQKGREKGYRGQDTTGWKVRGTNENDPSEVEVLDASGRSIWQGLAKGTDRQIIEYAAKKEAVPNAPFKDNWYQLGLKRAIKEAVDTGMDRVYLTTGARQADRYDLSKHIDRIDYNKNPDGSYNLSAIKNGTEVLAKEELTLAEVEQLVGKDMAKKMTAGEGKSNVPADRWEPEDSEIPQYKTLSGLDLKVGGEGMRQYYDKTYKNFLDKYAKQHGGKLGMTKIADGEPVYYIDLTDAMRNSAKKGQSYKAGGAVTMAEGGAVDYESRFNEMLQKHLGMAEGGAVDYESRFNEMLQKHVGMADGGEVNQYNSDPDMSDGGLFVAAPAFANGGAVKSIWTVN